VDGKFRDLEKESYKMFARSLFSGILLILAVMLVALASAAAANAQSEPICGSVEAFNRTHRWQDLPGCTENRDYSDGRSPVTLFGRAKDAFKGFFENWDKGDIDAAKTYLGGALGYTNGADDTWISDPQLAAAKPAYDEMMNKVKQYEEWLPYVEDLTQEYFNAATWIEEARKGKEGAAELAKMNSLDLQKSMDKAVAARVPETFIVPGIGTIKSATIAEIKQMIAPFIGQADAALQREKEADDAKWRPYTSLLAGDRLKFFNETYRGGTNVYGTGGKYLDTPEEFRTATVMCTRSFTTDQVIEQWRVRCWTFRGNAQVSGPRVQTGYGSTAPASAFR
jgi:hypothetical protein